MNSPTHTFTEEEDKLLHAAVAHAKVTDDSPHLEVRRIPYGFETNLPEYGEAIVDAAHKAKWEAALKRLITDGFLQRSGAGQQSWSYAVTDKGFASVAD